MKRILCLSDVHYSKNSELKEERWFPKTAYRKEKSYLRSWDTLTQSQLQKLIAKAKKLGPFDMVIDLGDGTPGVNQKGLISSRAQQERLEYQRILSQAFPAATKFYLWGDHDVGYRDFLWKIVESKITRESFQIAREILGPAWSSAVVGEFRFVFLNSEVTRNSPKPFLSKLRKEQQHFLEDTLKYAKRKVIIAIHDPFQIETFREILNRYLSKIELTLAGHFHLRIGKLLKLGKRKINLKIIPSPWGLALPWKTIGQGGFAILQLSSNSFSLEYQNL